jgi:NAD(P)-dependent dehydrogenase (short-subunit alcohol dehydrogenase family)
MSNKVWFITGASRGFGRIWTEAALNRGDKVAATARNLASISDLKEKFGDNVLTLELDVTNADQAKQAVKHAHTHFGRLDVVLNNAGYTLVGTIEEASDAEVRAVYDTNIFGALSVIRASLPLLRKQGSGHIVGVSSSLATVGLPLIGFYCSTKWAFEAIHESLSKEVKPFGIKVTILEPSAYATDFGSDSSAKIAPSLEVYKALRTQIHERLANSQKGDPNATSEAVLKVVDSENPPLRLILGSTGVAMARAAYAERLATWEAWEAVSNSAQGEPKKKAIAKF